jgi:hypothetical protein
MKGKWLRRGVPPLLIAEIPELIVLCLEEAHLLLQLAHVHVPARAGPRRRLPILHLALPAPVTAAAADVQLQLGAAQHLLLQRVAWWEQRTPHRAGDGGGAEASRGAGSCFGYSLLDLI